MLREPVVRMHKMLCVVEMFLPYPLCRERFTSHWRVFHGQNFFHTPKWQFLAIILRMVSVLREVPENQTIVNKWGVYSPKKPKYAEKYQTCSQKADLLHLC